MEARRRREKQALQQALRTLADELAGKLSVGPEARPHPVFESRRLPSDDLPDGYRGDYGIEDTRQALHEAQDYLPHMFGRAQFVVTEDLVKLPYKMSDIYRRITA